MQSIRAMSHTLSYCDVSTLPITIMRQWQISVACRGVDFIEELGHHGKEAQLCPSLHRVSRPYHGHSQIRMHDPCTHIFNTDCIGEQQEWVTWQKRVPLVWILPNPTPIPTTVLAKAQEKEGQKRQRDAAQCRPWYWRTKKHGRYPTVKYGRKCWAEYWRRAANRTVFKYANLCCNARPEQILVYGSPFDDAMQFGKAFQILTMTSLADYTAEAKMLYDLCWINAKGNRTLSINDKIDMGFCSDEHIAVIDKWWMSQRTCHMNTRLALLPMWGRSLRIARRHYTAPLWTVISGQCCGQCHTSTRQSQTFGRLYGLRQQTGTDCAFELRIFVWKCAQFWWKECTENG